MTRDGRWKSLQLGRWLVGIAIVALMCLPMQARAAGGTGNSIQNYSGLTASQQATLRSIAEDTWKFYSVDVDPNTHLPMDNVTFAGGSTTPTSFGRYTSAANIGVYLWAVVAANDLGLVSRSDAVTQITATLNELNQIPRYKGFLHQ